MRASLLFLRSTAFVRSVKSGTQLTSLGVRLASRTKLQAFDGADSLLTAVNAWSVNGPDLGSADFAANLFASSLLPYLGLLFFLSRPETNTPKLGFKGFCFLLVFVFATIPAGIIAKVQFGDILANVDLLHGSAEAFLTITNLLIISGFRQPREDATPAKLANTTSGSDSCSATPIGTDSFSLRAFTDSLLLLVPVCAILAAPQIAGALGHAEPNNALSIPTWAVHTSSLLEWLVAMKLIWEHAETSDNPRWKGMTWAMIPSHASGICACTYHFFYNSPVVIGLVSLQAALTVLGNSAMAIAAFRIYQFETQRGAPFTNSETGQILQVEAPEKNKRGQQQYAIDALDRSPLLEGGAEFWVNMLLKSVLLAVAVKYGELYLDLPFEPSPVAALVMIGLPTALNIAKWSVRSVALPTDAVTATASATGTTSLSDS